MMKKLFLILPIFLVSCATDYPCGEPRTGKCSNVTMNYEASLHGVTNPDDLPVDGSTSSTCSSGNCGGGNIYTKKTMNYSNSGYPQIPANDSPLVSTPAIMRVWYSPYVDSDNIYHDQEYQYMLVDRGRWIFGANSIFGRDVDSYMSKTTTLVQSTNDSYMVMPDTNQTANANKTARASANNQSNDTPALDFLKQQGTNNITSMGLGK